VHQELIEPAATPRTGVTDHPDSAPSRQVPEERYAFRHALVREAAYGTLTTQDRMMGHALAAAVLESRGERDPVALAEHWSRAGEPRRALPWLVRAAQSALEAANLEAAFALADRGVAAGASGEMLGHLRTIQAQVVSWEARWVEAANLAEEARGLVPLGSTEWFRAAVVTLFAAMSTNRPPIDVLAAIQSMPTDPEPSGPYARALSLLATGMVFAGQKEVALALLQRLVVADRPDVDPAFAGWRELARASASLLVLGDLGAALRHARAAIALLDDAGDPVGRALGTVALARALIECGSFAEAKHELDAAIEMADQLGTAYLRDWAVVLLAIANNRSGRPQEGLELARPSIERGGALTRFVARVAVANAYFLSGDPELAEREARASLDEAAWMPLASAGARALLARIELARNRPAAALAEAEEGLRIAAHAGEPLLDGSTLHLVRAEALHAMADPRALEVIREARARIQRVAEGIDDAGLRRVYLHDLELNARTLELAAAWCDGSQVPTPP
jgi:tetratricopeptide (TPR) repeat protein